MSDPKGETRAEKEAAAWFTRLSKAQVANGDLDDFFRWRRAPENAAAYARVEAVFTGAQDLAADPDIDAAAIEALNRHAQQRHRQPAWRDPKVLAAGLTLGFVVAVTAYTVTGLGQTYETGVGERRVIRLADGSSLQLNTDSRARVRLSKNRRLIALERGQAFFNVAHDRARPFVVDAGSVEVTALGTRFDVRRDQDKALVTLVQGRVAVRREQSKDAAITLEPGQAATTAGRSVPIRSSADIEEATSWTQGRLVFHDTPLSAAVAEVNRYSQSKLTLAANVDGEARINGAFDAGDVEAFAMAAADALDVAVGRSPNGLELRGDR